MFKFLLCSILIFITEISTGQPLNAEDLDNLLPKIPRDKNETIAAVVQDPVVKDAVQQAASNGSLDGLVVKKKVFIMPATDPKKVLSQREEVLVVPTEHLEDVRRNITEAKHGETDIDEYTTIENETISEGNSIESSIENTVTVSQNDSGDSSNELRKDTEIPENTIPQGPVKEISVPIVGVINPSNIIDDKVKTSVVALLPPPADKNVLANQVNFLGDNSEKILAETQSYVDGTSPAVRPENWKTSEIPASSQNRETGLVSSVKNREAPSNFREELFLTPIVVPRFEIVSPVFHNNIEYPRDVEDMDVAEDIIFRPLFRYRQEAQQRSKYREQQNYRRRTGYNNNYYNRYNQYGDYGSYSNRYYRYNRRSLDY